MDPLTGAALFTAASSLGGALQGGQASRQAFKDRQQRRDNLQFALRQTDDIKIRNRFNELQNMQAPFLNTLLQSQGLAGQQSASALGAGLARQGLGSTGLGATLGAGLRAGSAFQGNQLRARMQQDLLGQALNIQQGRAASIMGQDFSSHQGLTATSGAIQGVAGGITAAGLLFPNLFQQKQQPTQQPFGGVLG